MLRNVLCLLALFCLGATGAQAQFKATNVSVYIPSGIGGGYDAYARLVARHLSRFMPGNPVMVPKNMPGAGGVIAANYMYNVAPKDGSAIALFMAGAPFEPLFGNTQANYDPTKFNWIMSLNRLVNIAHLLALRRRSTRRTDFFKGEVLIGSSGGGDSSTRDLCPTAQHSRGHQVQGGRPATRATAKSCWRWSAARSRASSAPSSRACGRPSRTGSATARSRIVAQIGLTQFAGHPATSRRRSTWSRTQRPQGLRDPAGAAGERAVVRAAAGNAGGHP